MTDVKRVEKERIKRGIYWQRAWSLVEGCTPLGEGCRNCWSAAQTRMRAKQTNPKIRQRYGGLTDAPRGGMFNGRVRLMRGALDIPLRVKRPTTWAVWNDLFHESVDFHFIAEAFFTMVGEASAEAPPDHRYLVLTKRPHRMREFFDWLKDQEGHADAWLESLAVWAKCGGTSPRVWLGASASTQADLERVVPDLLETPAAVRFISYEPALEGIAFDADWLRRRCSGCNCHEPCPHGCNMALSDSPRISWVIVGAESGPKRRPMELDWARSVVEQCAASGTSCFVKQMDIDGRVSKDPAEWPEDLRIRQFPDTSES